MNTSGVNIQTEPITPPNAPSIIFYDEFSVHLSIETLTDTQTGGSYILYYDLWWDQGSSGTIWESYHSSLTESIGESIIKATINGLSSGETYRFKYRSDNIHGWSADYSPEIDVKTLIEPTKITGVTTLVESDYVRISWTEPYSGGVGVEITSYII